MIQWNLIAPRKDYSQILSPEFILFTSIKYDIISEIVMEDEGTLP